MAVPVPFGQYVPGDSPIHCADARVKIVLGMAYSAAVFTSGGWPGLSACAVILVAALAVSAVPPHIAARGLKAVTILLAFTLLANALRWAAPDAIITLGSLGVDPDGLQRGLFFSARIVLLVLGTSLVTLTTSPVALTDGLAQLMRPLDRLRVPVDDIAMMLSIALRFIPTTAEEAEKIMVAQTARGARFDEGGPIRRAKAWAPVLVPLFVNLFRRADDLAVAMESRCYRGHGRTRLHDAGLTDADLTAMLLGLAVCTAIAVLL